MKLDKESALQIGYEANSSCDFLTKEFLRPLCRERALFSHKGDYGHALLVSGSLGMMGAARLAASACLRGGAGLLTVHVPKCGYAVLQSTVAEAMVECDVEENHVSSLEIKTLEKYTAIGIGPGLGKSEGAKRTLKQLLQFYRRPILCDADALNLLAEDPTCLEFLPSMSVLTPHPGELERLIGPSADAFDRLEKTRCFASVHSCICLIKGAFTAVVCPSGKVYFNTSGNPGMATGGSGDVLAGLILSLMAQGYAPADAACLGVFLHGLAGDMALDVQSEESLLAGDIVCHLGSAFKSLKQNDF